METNMTSKIILSLVGLLSVVVLAGCESEIQPQKQLLPAQPESDGQKIEVVESEFCCGNFNENTGETRYYLSNDSNCGVPEGISCAGSCPSTRDKKFCI
jgi:hypothetical protein